MKIQILFLFIGMNAFAQNSNLEFNCNAQCIYVDPENRTFELGVAVSGWSQYSQNEAFQDLLQQCSYPYQLVQSVVGYRNLSKNTQIDNNVSVYSGYNSLSERYQSISIHKIKPRKIKGIEIKKIRTDVSSGYSDVNLNQTIQINTEDQMYFNLKFANPGDSCQTNQVNPNGGRRYSGNHPIGG